MAGDARAHAASAHHGARALAGHLARRARALRDAARLEAARPGSALEALFARLRRADAYDRAPEQAADAFAQTVAYGLVAARWLAEQHGVGRPCTGAVARDILPLASPALGELLETIFANRCSAALGRWVDDTSAWLDRTDIAPLLDAGGEDVARDPITHFYETFLAAYDPAVRRRHGVYFTPRSVVRFIVEGVDEQLRTCAGLSLGLADASRWPRGPFAGQHRVQILDPAAGTGGFLTEVISLVWRRMTRVWQQEGATSEAALGRWERYVAESLLPRLFGFELMTAPHAICQLKLALTLADTGLCLAKLPRFNVFLADALAGPEPTPPDAFSRVGPASEAARIKRDAAISVVVGNPPYSPSAQKSAFVAELVAPYKAGLGERKADLTREEWKFLRYAEWLLCRSRVGVLGFVINRALLDGVSGRVMRAHLAESFNHRVVIDLHGDVKGRAPCAASGPDENLFPIEQGVCIVLLTRGSSASRHVYWSIEGRAPFKRALVARSSVCDALGAGHAVDAASPVWVASRNGPTPAEQAYLRWPSIADVMPVHSSGIQTKRDALTVHFTRDELMGAVRAFAALDPESARARFGLPADGRDWSIASAQADVQATSASPAHACRLLYRPFDVRWTFYTGRTRGFLGYPRREVMRHLVGQKNLALIVNRQVVGGAVTHFGVSQLPICHGTFYLGNKGQDYLLPLYLFDDDHSAAADHGGRGPRCARANLAGPYVDALAAGLGLRFSEDEAEDPETTFGPSDVFHFLVAVLFSPTYRATFDEPLHHGFARVPGCVGPSLFAAMGACGKAIAAALTLEPAARGVAEVVFVDKAGRAVTRLAPRAAPLPVGKSGRTRLRINERSYFEGVPAALWAFELGGYRVLHKWLDARQKVGRTLSDDDIDAFCRIVGALEIVVATMARIDAAVDAHGGWVGAFAGRGATEATVAAVRTSRAREA